MNSTQIVIKGDIIYVAFDNKESTKDIHIYATECKNEEMVQYFDRYIKISRICAEMQKENRTLKIQMQYGHGDIEVLTKLKG